MRKTRLLLVVGCLRRGAAAKAKVMMPEAFTSLLLWEEHRVDVGEHTARRGDGDAAHVSHELVELVVAHLHVAGDDARLLVVAGAADGQGQLRLAGLE